MGTQELFYIQGEYIVGRLPAYAWFGLSRRGNKEDEHMGVFYRKYRLRAVETGKFWPSETPEAAGPRTVTWALFEDLHFAYRGKVDDEARRRAALLIA